MNIGPRGGSKSVIFGGGSLYLRGAATLSFLLCFEGLAFRSGVALALVSGARDPPFDSRFFNDSFLALDARSRACGASSFGLKSGFNGEETVGWWSSSRTRFWGIDEIGVEIEGVGSLFGDCSSIDILAKWLPA